MWHVTVVNREKWEGLGMQQEQNVVVLAGVSEAELSAQLDDDASSAAGDSAGTVYGSEHESVESVALQEILGVGMTSLAEWAWANAPHWLTPEKRQEYVDMFLYAAEIYQEWDAQAGEGSNMMDLYDIDEAYEGDGEAAAAA